MNYFTLIEDIKRTSLQFAEEFYEGDVYEFLNSGNHKYPSIILTTQNVSTTDNINSISGTLFCVDRLTDDSSNRLEIQSNAFNKLQRIISALEENTINLQSNTYTPFTEKFADLCGGMFVEFSFQYVGESLCDDLEIKEIELTQNGIYDVIGYDRAIVNVRPVVNLEDITITDNGEYTCGEGFDGFGKVNVDLRGKVKPSNLISFYQSKIVDSKNKDVIYLHDELSLDLIDLTNVGSVKDLYNGVSFTDNVRNKKVFYTLKQELSPTDISNFFEIENTFIGELYVDLKKLNTTQVRNFYRALGTSLSGHCWYDIRFDTLNSASDIKPLPNAHGCYTLVGDSTLDEVIQNNICCFSNVSKNLLLSTLNLNGGKNNTPLINRATLRSIVQGLLNVDNPKNLIINATLDSVMTDEERAIATNKGWTIII